MALPIAPVTSVPGVTSIGAPAAPKAEGAGGPGFGESLSRLVNAVDSTSESANTAIDQMLDGSGDVHTAMIALQRSELALQLTVQVRNKLVQAYQDIMKMPV